VHVSTLNYPITATNAFCMALFTLLCVIVGEGVTADKRITGDLDSMYMQPLRVHWRSDRRAGLTAAFACRDL